MVKDTKIIGRGSNESCKIGVFNENLYSYEGRQKRFNLTTLQARRKRGLIDENLKGYE
jgi:hypothetical protein